MVLVRFAAEEVDVEADVRKIVAQSADARDAVAAAAAGLTPKNPMPWLADTLKLCTMNTSASTFAVRLNDVSLS